MEDFKWLVIILLIVHVHILPAHVTVNAANVSHTIKKTEKHPAAFFLELAKRLIIGQLKIYTQITKRTFRGSCFYIKNVFIFLMTLCLGIIDTKQNAQTEKSPQTADFQAK